MLVTSLTTGLIISTPTHPTKSVAGGFHAGHFTEPAGHFTEPAGHLSTLGLGTFRTHGDERHESVDCN